ncbi:hypothetical protein [Clostridium beijerinckii]|nr:hypothetical protein [Clostridium beijerinckii]
MINIHNSTNIFNTYYGVTAETLIKDIVKSIDGVIPLIKADT